ncbi:hypothetical protein Bamb_5562 [Burkholderia ambifaria AMMD]|uniref:Uncharacterized protein n=1 Tax=Burkholderia ambifaria (strain ATCC BAA-244 / DSM 16087 / CCUG 44356 / LMG 19182 / AMMD) TaxID=339670 RepID=Q0B414_BURCM|nr:hypothetical protein Bamb_5562 [Burkholderia ambifaria AMMD]
MPTRCASTGAVPRVRDLRGFLPGSPRHRENTHLAARPRHRYTVHERIRSAHDYRPGGFYSYGNTANMSVRSRSFVRAASRRTIPTPSGE